jgi:RNA-directed DNA polymerase
MVGGRREHADALWDEVAAVLAPMGLRLSVHKTRVCHIDEGFDFLGWHIQRQAWRVEPGSGRSTPIRRRRRWLRSSERYEI